METHDGGTDGEAPQHVCVDAVHTAPLHFTVPEAVGVSSKVSVAVSAGGVVSAVPESAGASPVVESPPLPVSVDEVSSAEPVSVSSVVGGALLSLLHASSMSDESKQPSAPRCQRRACAVVSRMR